MGGVVSEPERHEREEPKRGGGLSYLYLAFGIGFVLAAIMVIITAGTPAAGIGFVIPAAIFLGLAANDSPEVPSCPTAAGQQGTWAPLGHPRQRGQHNAR